MHTTDQLNTALGNRYRIDRRVAAGGMATVYLARDLKHDREVALKVLNPELGAVLGVERFLSEIRVTANLQHPNLLPLFDSGEAGGLLYYVMPYVAGETLRTRLEREKQLPLDDAIRIAIAVAGALDYAHRHNVIHRDLKPENILLHEGQPLVADFGIALAVSNAGGARITQTGLSLGTPQYMSPEQATGDRVIDGRSDIYSLGAVLYEMLTGEPPHTGTTAQAIIARVLTERPRSIRSARPNVTAEVETAVERALEKLPADRYASASEFTAALQRPLAVTSLKPRAPTASRIRRIAWLVAFGIAGLAAGLAMDGGGGMLSASLPTEFEGELLGGSTIAFGPRVSPDGQTVAFVAMVDGLTQVGVLTPGTGSWTLLTRDSTRGIVDDVAWSLDGKRIYFDRWFGAPRGVYSIPALGGDERLVIDQAASPQVLPDNSILARGINDHRQSQMIRHWPETGRLDTLPAVGGVGFLGTFFRALPSGREVVFYGKPAADTIASDHLWMLDLQTKRVRRIAPALAIKPPFWRFPLAVSADEKRILFDFVARDLHRIVAVPSDGSNNVRTLVTLTSGAMGLDVGRDGSLYLDQGSQPSELLWFAPATGRLDRMPVPESAGPPLVLSDGRVLVTTHAGGWRVLVASGSEARPLIDTPAETNAPMVQMGADRVALVLGTTPKRKVVLASITTGQIVGTIDGIDAEKIQQLAATPDGKTLFYVADNFVWAIATEGGPPRRVRRGDGVAIHPDGKYLVIKLDERERVRLVRMAWPSGAESPLRVNEGPLRIAFGDFTPNAIARDGRILVRVGSAASWYYPIAILNPETGALSRVGSTFEDMLAGGWAPDGRVVTKTSAMHASLWRYRPTR